MSADKDNRTCFYRKGLQTVPHCFCCYVAVLAASLKHILFPHFRSHIKPNAHLILCRPALKCHVGAGHITLTHLIKPVFSPLTAPLCSDDPHIFLWMFSSRRAKTTWLFLCRASALNLPHANLSLGNGAFRKHEA